MSFLQLRSPRIQNPLANPSPPASTDLNISVSDSTTLSESIKLLLESNISKSETVTTAELVNVSFDLNVALSDSTSLSESIKVELNSFINVSDNITLSEALSVLVAIYVISVSDSTNLSESLKVELNSFINKSDSTTLTDTPTVVVVPADLQVVVTPGIQQIQGVRIV